MEVRPIDRNQPVVDAGFRPLQNLQIFCAQVKNSIALLFAAGPSGSFEIDDGSASASGAFLFDDGGA